jgi:DNA-binding NarL/FixJ family response regulator
MRALCFVDDDAEEVRRFREQLRDRYLIGAGSSLAEAVADLERQGRPWPDLFVLDMYFPEGPPNTPDELRELGEAWSRFLEAKAAFLQVLERLGQSARGGIALANAVRGAYPEAAFSFFTRKGTLEDAIAGLEAGAASIIKKPDPTPEEREGRSLREACDRAFHRGLDTVVRGIEQGLARAGRNQG